MATTLDRLCFVNVNPDGTYRSSGDEQSTPADVKRITEHISADDGPPRVVLHFHGGLVNETHGFASAERIAPVYRGVGSHPIMVIWETGFLETIRGNLGTIHQSPLFQKLLKIAIKNALKQLGADIGKGPAEAPTEAEIDAALLDDRLLLRFEEAARGGATAKTEKEAEDRRPNIENDIELDLRDAGVDENDVRDDAAEFLAPEIVNEVGDAEGRGIELFTLITKVGAVVVAVVKRYIRKRSHGLYNTVIEEILRQVYVAAVGEWIWGSMKNAAMQTWKSNAGLADLKRHPGRDLIEGLAAAQAKRGIAVDLVGHSAGAIAIIGMLKTIDEEDIPLRVRNVAFLAPACTSALFHGEVVQKEHRYERFRMYTMVDDLETKDPLVAAVPALYRSSLLYFISGVLESESDVPIAGMERYLTAEQVYAEPHFHDIRIFLREQGHDRLILAKTGDTAADGLRCWAEHHGGFAEEAKMSESLAHFVR